MDITFDIFLSNPALLDRVQVSPEVSVILNELYSFVQGRLAPLQEAVEKEETSDPEKPKGTIILLESPPGDPNRIIGFHGYSPGLTQKMAASFGDNDAHFMKYKIEEYLNGRQN